MYCCVAQKRGLINVSIRFYVFDKFVDMSTNTLVGRKNIGSVHVLFRTVFCRFIAFSPCTSRRWFYYQGENRTALKALEIKGFAEFDAFLSMTVKSGFVCM